MQQSLIKRDDIDAYHRDGAVLLRQVMPGEWLGLLAQGLDEVYDTAGKLTSRVADSSGPGPGEIRVDQVASASNAKIRVYAAGYLRLHGLLCLLIPTC